MNNQLEDVGIIAISLIEMKAISVKKCDAESYEVLVEGQSPTTHTVTLTQDYYQKLTKGRIPPEDLIEKSFTFLLERESNTMILRRFDLPLIGNYFPEYEQTMVKMWGDT